MTAGRRSFAALLPVLLAALVACLGAAPADAAGRILTPYRDAVAYTANLATTGSGRTWTGTEAVTVRNASPQPMDRLWMRLWGNGPQGCFPRAVTITAVDGAKAGRLERRCSAAEIVLPAVLAPGAETTFTLTLTITAPLIQDRFGVTDGIELFGNALPVVAQHDRGGWQLPHYSRYGESFVSSWARFALTLHHPATLKVAASGTTLTALDPGGQTATTTSTIDARDTFWAIGDMVEEDRTTARGTRIRAWSAPDSGADREDSADQAVGAMEQLERHLPDYPYPEFDVIVARIDAGGGMEYPGVVLTDASSEVTRHETGHQWFYGWVGDDQYREPWIDEGITSFLEYTWTTAAQLPRPQCYVSSQFVVAGPATFVTSSMQYWNRHPGQYTLAYDNPVCALREVRDVVGVGTFGRVMRALVTNHAAGFLTGAEVRAAFRHAGGKRIDPIWARWGMAPGRR